MTKPFQLHNEELYDATGALALTRFAAAMESMLTPRNSQWHSLQPSDPALKKRRNVQLWFEELTQMLFKYRYAPAANFASQQHENYMALGAFGTGCTFIDRLQPRYGKGLRYRAVHLGEVRFCENHQGIIDTVIRRFRSLLDRRHKSSARRTFLKKSFKQPTILKNTMTSSSSFIT